jgi:two-component system catabolic regulation response regulator CreB/two-component system response regulator ChvI
LRKRKRIFIVDDDNDVILTFKVGLENYGFEVYTYNDPVIALLNYKFNFYDLLLIDIRMPKINGFELAYEIRKKDRSVKICFITAFEVYYEAIVDQYVELDFKCFIKKPIMIDDPIKRIERESDFVRE